MRKNKRKLNDEVYALGQSTGSSTHSYPPPYGEWLI